MSAVEHSSSVIKNALTLYEDPVLLNCKSGSEYLLTKMQPFSDSFTELLNLYEKFLSKSNNKLEEEKLDEADFTKLLNDLTAFSGLINDCIINGKITSLTAADLEQGEGKIFF